MVAEVKESQEATEKSLCGLQQVVERLISSMAAMNTAKQIDLPPVAHQESFHCSAVLARTHLHFPSFDGTNFRDWHAKAEQLFEFEGTQFNRELDYCCSQWKAKPLLGRDIMLKHLILTDNLGKKFCRMWE